MANHNALLIEDTSSLRLEKKLEGTILQRVKDLISPYPTHEEDWMSLTWSKERSALLLASWPAQRLIEIPFTSISRVNILLQEPRLFASLFTIWLHYLDKKTPRTLRLLIRVKQLQDPIELVFRIARILGYPSYQELWKSDQFLYLSLETEPAPTAIDYRRPASSLIAISTEARALASAMHPTIAALEGSTGDLIVREWRPGELVSFSVSRSWFPHNGAFCTFSFDLTNNTLKIEPEHVERAKDRGTQELSPLSTLYLRRDSTNDLIGTRDRALIMLGDLDLFATNWMPPTREFTPAQICNAAYPSLTRLSAALGIPWGSSLSLGCLSVEAIFGYALLDGTAIFLQGNQLLARSPDQHITQLTVPKGIDTYSKLILPHVTYDGLLFTTSGLSSKQHQFSCGVVSWHPSTGLREIWRSRNSLRAVSNDKGTLLIYKDERLFRKRAGEESPTLLPQPVGFSRIENINVSGGDFFLSMLSHHLLRSTDEGDTWTPLRTLPSIREGNLSYPARAFTVDGALWFISWDEAYCISGLTLRPPMNIELLGVVSHQGRTLLIGREYFWEAPNEASIVLFLVEGEAMVRLAPVTPYGVGTRPIAVDEHSPPRIDALYLQEPYSRGGLRSLWLYSAISQPDGIYLTGANGFERAESHHGGGTILCIPQWEIAPALLSIQ